MSNERKIGIVTAICAILIAMLVAMPLVRAGGGTEYSFNLVGPNVSKAAASIPGTHLEAGDFVRLTGSGTFDTSTGAVSGYGSFEHIKFDGTPHSRGFWTVKQFVSFDSYGGPSPGKQGGLLKVIVEVIGYHVGEAALKYGKGPTVNIFIFEISSEGVIVWAGPGFVIPAWSIVVSGHVFFHLNE